MNKTAAAPAVFACLGTLGVVAAAWSAPTSVTVKTDEVTTPAIAVSPDGHTLVFGLLGHLFELPVAGGQAIQLTFGPSYDSDPAMSPDGSRIAFVSNRDGSGSNIFVLERANKRVSQVTHEFQATRPAWSPDGRTIAYARDLSREDHPHEQMPGFGDTGLRSLRTVAVADGKSGAVGPPEGIETVFYLPDGRLATSVREFGPTGIFGPPTNKTKIEVRAPDGSSSVLASASGDIGRVTPTPKGDAVYYVASGAIQRLALSGNSAPVAAAHVQESGNRVAVGADGTTLYFGDAAHLWRASAEADQPQQIDFAASVALQVQPRVKTVARFSAPDSVVSMRPALAPTLSPDGQRLVVMAGGFLWEQALSGGAPAVKLIDSKAFMRYPVYSPDGRQLVFAASENGKRRLDVYDLASKRTKTLFKGGGAEWPLFPSWSPDGRQVVFQHALRLAVPSPIVVVNVSDGTQIEVAKSVGSWLARPHFSSDGRSVYFTSRPDKIAALYKVADAPGTQPQKVTDFKRHVHETLVSADGKWLAQRRNSEVWVTPMSEGVLTDKSLRRLSSVGGRSFAFTPDSQDVVYSANGKVFRQSLSGGAAQELPVHITVHTPHPAPLLVSNVHVLDLTAGRFSEPQSLFIEDGRIGWIGSERARKLPANVVRLDGKGGYAIPGLFDVHVHSAWYDQQTNEDAFIAFGVTSVRDTGSALDLMIALNDRSNLTTLPAPRYFYSGEIFEGEMPLWGDVFYTISNEQEARAEVRYIKANGASFVKIYPSLPWKLQGIVSDEARRVGLAIVGHGQSLEETVRRVVWGSTSIEHSYIARAHQDVLKMLAATHVAADPTLAVGGSDLMVASDPNWLSNWRVREYVPAESRVPHSLRGDPPPDASQTREQLLVKEKDRLDGIDNAFKDGVKLTAGTDSLMGGVYFGLSLHWEIAQFVDAGLTPAEALRMATQGAADLVGASKDLGSLTPGKLADVVLLNSSPLENIRNTQDIAQVIKGGQLYDPGRLRPEGQVSVLGTGMETDPGQATSAQPTLRRPGNNACSNGLACQLEPRDTDHVTVGFDSVR